MGCQMKHDFKRMEEEMDSLTANMASITESSASISDTLQDRRQQITKLSGVHTLLKKASREEGPGISRRPILYFF